MMTVMRRLGDALLQRVLPQLEAGACVPEHGQVCYCRAPCPKVDFCSLYRFNCNGVCINTFVLCEV